MTHKTRRLAAGLLIPGSRNGESDVHDDEGCPRAHEMRPTFEPIDQVEPDDGTGDNGTCQSRVDARLLRGFGDAHQTEDVGVVLPNDL